MMKFSKLFLTVLAGAAFLVSCSNEDDVALPAGAYSDGFFVLNEGGSGQGSVSFIGKDLQTMEQDAYGRENESDLVGKYLQSMFISGDYAYIISGGSNKINVVNRHTFKLVAKIETGLKSPRYGVVKDGKAYVTNANTFPYDNPETGETDDFVAVINLSTNLVEATIPLNATANRIVLANDRLYITEPYSNDKVLVLNPATNSLENPITVGFDADTMEERDGTLYILRSPYGTAAELVKVKLSDSGITKVAFPSELSDVRNLDVYEDKVYYTAGTSVYAMDLNAASASTTAVLSYNSDSQFGKMYGFAVNNGRIFIADGGDFTANSKAYVYSLSGSFEKEFTVGVGPNGFYFN